ncbi:unnamed protein product [Moneuplotes crassus]|uniref:Uncharacterized protein n=2 Tax=Euplotes crassus TaxID=5936 RepID=A0AAD1UQK3_EUPCR|nr:unnamed protein product [Moneuplotes crassus]
MAERRPFKICCIFDIECCFPTNEDIREIDLLNKNIKSEEAHTCEDSNNLILRYVRSLIQLADCFPEIKIVLYLHHNSNRAMKKEIEKIIRQYRSEHEIRNIEFASLIVSSQALFHHLGFLQMICEETRIFTRNKNFYQPGFIDYKRNLSGMKQSSSNSFLQEIPMIHPLHKAPTILANKVDSFADTKKNLRLQNVNHVLNDIKDQLSIKRAHEDSTTSPSEYQEAKEMIENTKSEEGLGSTEISTGEETKIDDIRESCLSFSSEATFITKSSMISLSQEEVLSQASEIEFLSQGSGESKKASSEGTRPPTKYDFETEFYQESTMKFFCKLYSHFKNKFSQESVSFINSLKNLVLQHLTKMSKKADHSISEDEKLKYFIYIRNKLYIERFVKGTLFEFWTKHNINTLSAMNESTKLTVDIEKLEEVYQKYDSDKSQKQESTKSSKIFTPITDVSLYASICYTIIKTMSDKHFYHEYGSETSYKKYMKVIENLLKNMYNSRALEQNQRTVLKKDKSIRYLLMKLFENYGVFKVKPNKKLEFCNSALEQFCNNIEKYSCKDLIQMLNRDIQSMEGTMLN